MGEKLHPVLFTESQIGFIKHMINEKAIDYWEEECVDILSAIEQAEKVEKAKITYQGESY